MNQSLHQLWHQPESNDGQFSLVVTIIVLSTNLVNKMQMQMPLAGYHCQQSHKKVPIPPEIIHMLEHIDTTPVSVFQFRTQTVHDLTLS